MTGPGGSVHRAKRRWIKTWIFLIFMSVHSKIFPEFDDHVYGDLIFRGEGVREVIPRRCDGAWDGATWRTPSASSLPSALSGSLMMMCSASRLFHFWIHLSHFWSCLPAAPTAGVSLRPLLARFARSHPPSQFGKRVSTLCRKCNGTNAAGINVGTNVGTRGRSLARIFSARWLRCASMERQRFWQHRYISVVHQCTVSTEA